uniref:G-protein coupled receptors family 1 profile domain-containing protein n=1 Tax=Sus scrofa TaxID=9823 RepID=A0A8D1FX34_PIG
MMEKHQDKFELWEYKLPHLKPRNQTAVTEFLFLGLTDHLHQQIILFVTLVFVYLVTLGDDHSHLDGLQTPHTYVLCDIFADKKGISFLGYAAQMWFLGLFVATECFLLAAMAYDRYLAICKPLLYSQIMSQRVCVQLVMGPYAVALMSTMTHTTLTFCLPFCGPNVINHFFCDISPLLSLACADTSVIKFTLFTLAGTVEVLSSLIIMISYVCILVAILRIQTAGGRRKAFSTCSHLAAVSILYGTLFFIYVRPGSSSSLDINKVVSLFYTVVTPMLNPLIYSLRNKEVKNAFSRKFERNIF